MDETPGATSPTTAVVPAAQVPWMVAWWRSFIHAALYDEDAAKGWAVVGLGFLASLVASGGVIPGTEVVVPIPSVLAKYGAFLNLLALRLATGGGKKAGGI